MNPSIENLLQRSDEAAQALFAWSWQALLLLALLYLFLRIVRFRAASIRYHIWLFSLLTVALLPVGTALVQHLAVPSPKPETLQILVDVPSRVMPLSQTTVEQILLREPHNATSSPFLHWWSLALAVWAVGFLFALGRLARTHRRTQNMRSKSQHISLEELGCGELKENLIAARMVDCHLSESVSTPVLVGLWRPTILLPKDLLLWTTAEERKAILLHELIHAQRGDHWENAFQLTVATFFFYHPLVRYACKQVSIERELSCDEHVLLYGAKASSYVESILKVAEKSIVTDVVHQPAFITKKMLERRIEMIMQSDRLKWSARRWTLLILPILFLVVMVWVLAPGRSASAQQSPEPQKDVKESSREGKEKALIRELEKETERKLDVHGAEVLAQVSELRVYSGKHHEGENLIDVMSEQTEKHGDEVIHTNVIVKTPEFTFKAEHGEERHGIINLAGSPLEIEHNGQVYYSDNSISVAQRGSVVLYVLSKHTNLYTEKNHQSRKEELATVELSKALIQVTEMKQQGGKVEFGKLLRESNQ